MQTFDFQALGTVWSVVVDIETSLPESLPQAVTDYLQDFESRFSRFLPKSEANAFRETRAGTYPVSPEFAVLLQRASLLRELTGGVYDPVVGGVLESIGYGGQSGLAPVQYGKALPAWFLTGETLTLDGPVAFDFGGIGKGYAIDRVAAIVRAAGYPYFIVDGGGDMFGATKADGQPWRVAIEYPGKPDTAAGVVELSNRGLAVSDSFRRRWGTWHHLINPGERQNIKAVVGCASVAPDAWSADCMTSGLFFSLPDQYPKLAEAWGASYIVFHSGGQAVVSHDWQGELY
ncbi:MAG: FAD:protein FMN transferase [Candidatus Moraniibacteriota bacterium]